ncbi:MAG: PQQ-dependent dehydrogenase, methanol/ethanol family [Myxococcota bacterium]
MPGIRFRSVLLPLLFLLWAAAAPAAAPGAVDAERIRAADREPGAWPSHGRTYDEQRFSPLDQVNRGNVARLGLAWSYATGTTRGLEATPIVVDGVMYATGSWSVVFALDAKTGREIWRYDPQVPKAKGRDACCDVVNRGVAVWKGRVYVGTIDGRLVALDAATGTPVWDVATVDPERPYTITGAPRVVKDKVIIGNGGAEFGVRGYVSAYDANSGERVWRFYTVPASKEGPHEHPELARAAETWPADALWESGLGGTAWDAMAYDPELDLLYVGTGNSSVYDREKRSPGGGDNLYLASILALRPDTGKLVWHYQTTPGEYWDYTATQHIVLADLTIGGEPRKVLLQAPKNGFFYVLDRATGELLSAEKFATVSWATHVDLATGRPVERPEAHWGKQAAVVAPAVVGAHNWHPMSFHPGTGLVYVPAMELSYIFEPDPAFRYRKGFYNTAEDLGATAEAVEGYEFMTYASCSPSRLLAWDPVAQRKVWEVRYDDALQAGILSTAGGLVFQGGDGTSFDAYDAKTGARLWSVDVGLGVMAAPVSYSVGDEQYVAVLAGQGGSLGGHFARIDSANEGRRFAFKLGGKEEIPPVAKRPPAVVEAPKLDATPEVVAKGRDLYAQHCMRCHGVGAVSAGLYPDLRHAKRAVHEAWDDVVLGGTRGKDGMASFADVLTKQDARAIHAYVSERALAEPALHQQALAWLVDSGLCIPASWLTD